MFLYVCDPANTGTTRGDGGLLSAPHSPAPTCSGGGYWIDTTDLATSDPITKTDVEQMVDAYMQFQIDQLDPAILAQAFGAGFITLGTGLIIVMAIRLVVHAVKSA